MSEVSCPKCDSKKVSVYDKEIQTAWRLGLPKLAEYKRGAKETFKECACQICGHKFRFLPSSGETRDVGDVEEWKMLRKHVKLTTAKGETIETVIDAIMVTVKVNVGESEVVVDDQMSLTIPASKELATPALVFEDDIPVGVCWAGGRDEQGNFHGIVVPIRVWKSGTKHQA